MSGGRPSRPARRLSPPAGPRVRLFLVDDHRVVLSGIEAELAEAFEIVGTAIDVDAAVADIRRLRPEVVLLDVHLPGGGAQAVLAGIADLRDEVRVLALSVSDAPEDVIATVRAGARGYVTKTIEPDRLADAVRSVAGGDAVFSPRLAGFVLDAFASAVPAAAHPELDQLSPREREVLREIARGRSYRQVAGRLSISVKTVESHVSAVLRKLQLSNRHELSRWAAARRLV